MKIRADVLCVARGLCGSRTQAGRLIDAAQVVLADGTVVRKPSQLLEDDADIRVLAPMQYVSRGAYKLLGALDAFPHDMTGAVALDLGASTGGFTDVLLQRGANRVYAVDVGTGQLHERLRSDPRVVSLEQTNAKELSKELIPEGIDVLVADVSFISLRKVLPFCAVFLNHPSWICVLVKPQFEATPQEIGKNGIVKDEAVRRRCVESVVTFCRGQLGWHLLGTVPSPIQGGDGNQEYLAVFSVD